MKQPRQIAYLFGMSQSVNCLRIIRKCNQVKRGSTGRYPRRYRAKISTGALLRK
jgi:hypothetical protein